MSTALAQHLTTLYENSESTLEKVTPHTYKARHLALTQFIEQGLPSIKNETWKYTPTHFLKHKQFSFNKASTPLISPHDILAELPNIEAAYTVIFYNGRLFHTEGTLSQHTSAEATSVIPSEVCFDHLNEAFYQETCTITLAENTELTAPIHIIYYQAPDAEDTFTHPRTHITLKNGVKASIIETYHHAAASPNSFINARTHIQLDENTYCTHMQLFTQSNTIDHVQHTSVDVSEAATYHVYPIQLGTKWSHQTLSIHLNGKMANTKIIGFNTLSKHHHVDQAIAIHHHVPYTDSDTHIHSIARDHARVIFNGAVKVDKQAAHSQAHMLNKNVLLSTFAEANTRPQLEIYNEDIQCTHGATVGHLDDGTLFYLISRGIDRVTATNMLVHAFLETIICKISCKHMQAALKKMLIASGETQDAEHN